MSQAVKCDLFLYADDTCLVCQHKDINKIENLLNKDFCNICDWFVDNKLSIHFGEDKRKSILFASKFKRKNIKKLFIKYVYKSNNILKSGIYDAYWMKQCLEKLWYLKLYIQLTTS